MGSATEVSTPEHEDPLLFRETNASGRSLKNWVTKYGGASKCLTVTITASELRISFSLSSLPPFSLLPKRLRLYQEQAIMKQSDLDHRIPRDSITSITSNSFLGRQAYVVEYRDASAVVHRLEIVPTQYGEFERALHVPTKVI